MKIDTESTEPDVLRGAAKLLARDRPNIFCEVLKGRGAEGLLEEILEPLGYRFFLLTPEGAQERERIEGHPQWLNYLFTTGVPGNAGLRPARASKSLNSNAIQFEFKLLACYWPWPEMPAVPRRRQVTIRLAALVPYPVGTTPSQRFRLEQWEPLLEKQGIHVDFFPFADDELFRQLHSSGSLASKAIRLSMRFASRIGDIARSRSYDAVVVHRGLSIAGTGPA